MVPPEDPAVGKTLGLGKMIVEVVQDDGLRDFLIASLLLSLRSVAKVTRSSNPTWTRNGKRHSISKVDPHEALVRQARSMLHDLNQLPRKPQTRADIIFEDSTRLNLDGPFDAIITSPPYLTRIDYIVNFRMENEFLANLNLPKDLRITELRDQMIGTVTIPDRIVASKEPNSSWGPTCVRVLQRVKAHPAKASLSYYYPTIYNYFDRIFSWMRNSHDALRDNGLMFIVVQTSHFKEIEIPIGDIFLEMGRTIGFRSTRKLRTEAVRTHMGLLSPQQRLRALNKVLHEDVLLLMK